MIPFKIYMADLVRSLFGGAVNLHVYAYDVLMCISCRLSAPSEPLAVLQKSIDGLAKWMLQNSLPLSPYLRSS